jgi:16S rRNA (adenine1518-N6/adenine1519-N6)-dimethyltransferase
VDEPIAALPPLDVHGLLKRFNLHPDRRLGQNFLVDSGALQRVVATAAISTQEAVLEIGPGLGSLTRYLSLAAKNVVAVELDDRLMPALNQVLAPYQNVELVQGDILALDPVQLMKKTGISATPYLVAANIPYYITSALIRHFLETLLPPTRMVLTVQREVAERICAGPGKLSLLALSVQVYGSPAITTHIPARAFYPEPRVDSAVVRVDINPSPFIQSGELKTFFRLAKAGFSQKRKTLRNALAAGMHWSPADVSVVLNTVGIDPIRRAETLSLQEWGALVRYVQNHDLV